MPQTTLVVLNANVVTLSSRQSRAEAIAVQNGRIIAVGSNTEIRKYMDQHTTVVDAKGKTVVPGLIDCHVHMAAFGLFLQQLNLRNVESIREMQQKIRKCVAENVESTWILGGRWDHEKFAEKRYPTRWDLDAAVADRPVFLVRVCGHMAVANSKALRLAGLVAETIVEGGSVDLDPSTGQPNGILRENALALIPRVIPEPTMKQREQACILACEKAVEAGLTGVHWLVDSAEEIRILQKLDDEGKLPLRVYLGVPVEFLDELVKVGFTTGFGNEMVKLGFVKILSDGSLGAQTAALKKPYSDSPRRCGMMLYTRRKLNEHVLKAHKAGLQLGIHAIGDRAIENVLNALEEALRKFPRKDCRHRIEHCSVLSPTLIRRMKHLHVLASVQPHFIVSDFWTAKRLGKKRFQWTYPFKTLKNQGVVVASGSDCPIESISPLLGIWAAVCRKDNVNENLTVTEALQTYTVNAAFSSFDEHEKGTIETGKFADFVILSDDPFSLKPSKIKTVTVEMTVVNGKAVYVKKDFR
jgi:predicted amidohydrolase YtcJ